MNRILPAANESHKHSFSFQSHVILKIWQKLERIVKFILEKQFSIFVQLNDSQFPFVKMSKFIPKKFTTAKLSVCVCVCVCVCVFTQFCDVAQVVMNRKMISQIWLKTEYDSVKNFKAVFCIIGYHLSITYWNLM